MTEALLASTGLVALAEIGDKTQILTLALAARHRRPMTIILAIFFATILNHALAALFGQWVRDVFPPALAGPLIGAGFILIGLWTLIPDRIDDEETMRVSGFGVFLSVALIFFLAEIGDKTQVATVALAARYQATLGVVIGTTLGMMLANVPVVFLGSRLVSRLPLAAIRRGAALLFILFGILAFLA